MPQLLLCLLWLISLNLHAATLSTRYSYDEAGNKTSQTDALGHVTQWTYSVLNQITSRTLPDGSRESFSYDSTGQLTSHTDFNNQTTRYGYDALNRLILTQYPDGRSVKNTYNASQQLDTVTESQTVNGKIVNQTTKYNYDINNRLVKATYPNNQSISYSYDAVGNLLTRSTVNGTTKYSYDANNQLISVIDSKNQTTNYDYDSVGRLTTTQLPNGSIGLREYTNKGYLQQIAWKNAQGQLISATRYSLLANGQRNALTRYDAQSSLQEVITPEGQRHWELSNPSYQIDVNYDSEQRLIAEHHRDLRNQNELHHEWTYDGVGNRQQQIETKINAQGQSSTETTSYSYDNRDRLLSSTTVTNTGSSMTTTYQWDNNGRLIKKVTPSEITLYVWRSDDRLLAVKQGSSEATAKTLAIYQYDAKGNRIQRTTGDGVVTEYLTDTNFAYAQTLEEKENGEVTRYEWGSELISADNPNHSVNRFYHQDGLGSVVALTTPQGEISKTYEYEVFGKLTQSIDNTKDKNRYLYTGEYSDTVIGQQYNRARWYDKESGRFTSIDPHLGVMQRPETLHDYMYVANNAVNFNDPTGEMLSVMVGLKVQMEMHLSQTSVDIQKMRMTASKMCSVAAKVADSFGSYGKLGKFLAGQGTKYEKHHILQDADMRAFARKHSLAWSYTGAIAVALFGGNSIPLSPHYNANNYQKNNMMSDPTFNQILAKSYKTLLAAGCSAKDATKLVEMARAEFKLRNLGFNGL